ncbi:hypothetical protein [Xenorhabdus kozodoii]|uniref:Uncharacterized protein n=1 Tax=Xenorhabdus kozodoii TaxID=351676 RepID=A0A2D0L5E7_9GAMM|nr:hypothetical protein [Xenorhabdus kozodoii]PHM69133.1 hypothetical protein Xkoz_03524 [Xenorhabdus kozodoii]PHM70890.1 hypothetical protein Xkoz_02898 [Xenorhabdus kozodoii]
MKIEYAVIGANKADRYTLKNNKLGGLCPQSLAEICAEDFSKHDGWGAYWPIDIVVFVDGKLIGLFTVAQEFNPIFTASMLDLSQT